MKTNDLKKGHRIMLENGWMATIADNMKGDTRMATVEGLVTEMGSVYSHDIMWAKLEGDPEPGVHHRIVGGEGLFSPIEHTPKQLKLKEKVATLF